MDLPVVLFSNSQHYAINKHPLINFAHSDELIRDNNYVKSLEKLLEQQQNF